ncbi:carbohydrate ABC transporter permease [uncultured Sphaerochaeta sp.]|uniref:carbohydrate ABC transporter permease n=1 Tax=uncultured Sphaerochaeta sp. TaxID=886478 RepID=UPI002A0A20A2|nr:carbohydrate ABC transporter permease [uncultured Sphaerochaeta sp.]
MRKSQQTFNTVLVNGFMALVVIVCLFPVLWMCIISIKTVGEKVSGFHALVIGNPTFENFRRLFDLIPIWNNLFNSMFTTVIGTITTLFFCALAGFAFAKYKFPGRNFLFYFVIATMMISAEAGAIPLFVIMRKLHLINSLWSLIIPRIATAVGIFYLRQYILEVPDELIEASRIDGCKDFGIFIRIVVPIIKPALASWASITMIARWNDFFWPLLFLNKNTKYTLMVSVSMLPVSDGLATPWQVILAGTTLVIVPSILLYLAMQGFQKSGSMAGAVKG